MKNTITTTLRDRIAAALHQDQTPPPVTPWEDEAPLDREYFLRRADAVLAVLPTLSGHATDRSGGLITDHWFREGPVQPDGSDGYWICDRCGQHRGDHLQIEGHWRNPLHIFVQQRYRTPHCKICGRHHRHTTHTPWLWEQLEAAAGARQDGEER